MSTTAEANRSSLLAAWQAIDGEGRLEEMGRWFAPGYVRRSAEGEYTREGFRDVLAALKRGFPDLSTRIEDAVAEGDRVAYRWVAVGTHAGDYLGIGPTHKRIAATGITISRFDSEGLIVEDWASWNKASVLHALGIIPLG